VISGDQSEPRKRSKKHGPQTSEGKAIASRNPTKHGLLARETLLPWENSEELADLTAKLKSSLKPEGELEFLLTDRIVSLTWRLCRAGRIETAIYVWRKYSLSFEVALADMRSYIKSALISCRTRFSVNSLRSWDIYSDPDPRSPIHQHSVCPVR
jgi:hypothetical protein